MKQKPLVALGMLALLMMGFCCIVLGSRSNDRLTTAEAPQIREAVSRATSPKTPHARHERPDSADPAPQTDICRETGKHFASVVTNAELPARCDSLLRASGRTTELRQTVRRWAETNGPAAASWVDQLQSSSTHLEVLTAVALGWGGANLPAAVDWANSLPEGESRATAIEQLGYTAAQTDAVQAVELAASLEPGHQRDDLLEHAIGQWATSDLDAAVHWAKAAVSDAALRQRLLATVAVAVAGQDGAAAAALAATALDPGTEQDRVAVAIVQRWVQHEPEEAAAWVAQFPDTQARESTVQNLVAFWAAQDRQAAANWLQALPEGTLHDAGMTAYSQALATTEIAATE
jgi:hypothetical protein